MIRRIALGLALLTVVSVTVGAAAVLPMGPSAPLQVFDPAEAPLPTIEPPATSEPPQASDDSAKVWVCVVLEHKGSLTLKPGKNPIEVSANSQNVQDADSPDHPSYRAVTPTEPCRIP